MSRRTRRVALLFAAVLIAHELLLWRLSHGDSVSALFSAGPQTPASAVVLAAVMLVLRLTLYFVLPFAAVTSLLSDALARWSRAGR